MSTSVAGMQESFDVEIVKGGEGTASLHVVTDGKNVTLRATRSGEVLFVGAVHTGTDWLETLGGELLLVADRVKKIQQALNKS